MTRKHKDVVLLMTVLVINRDKFDITASQIIECPLWNHPSNIYIFVIRYFFEVLRASKITYLSAKIKTQ